MIIDQFAADIEIWSHQRYNEVPALAPSESAIFMTFRAWAPLQVFQVATGNVGTEMIKRIGQRPDLRLVGLHCYTPEKIGRDVGGTAGIGPIGVIATGAVEDPDVLTFHGVVCSADVAEIENVTTIESVDVSCHHSADTW